MANQPIDRSTQTGPILGAAFDPALDPLTAAPEPGPSTPCSSQSPAPPAGAADACPDPSTHAAARRRYLRRAWQLLIQHKATIGGILAASLTLNLLGLVTPRLTQAILDRIIPTGDMTLLGRIVLVLMLVAAYQITLTIWRRLAVVRLTLILGRVMLREFCDHLLSLPAGFFKSHRSADLAARFTDESYVRHLFTTSLARVTIDALMALVYLAVMFWYSVPLTLVVLGFLLLFATYTLATGPLLKRAHQRVLEARAAQETQLLDILTNIELVKAMAVERSVRGRWEAGYRTYLETDYRTKRLRQVLESVSTAVQVLCTVGLLWFGALLVIDEQLTTGELVAFCMYASQALLPLLSLLTLSEEVQQARAALQRVSEVLREQPESSGRVRVEPGSGGLRGHVVFDHVWFQYEGQNGPLLSDVSFEIRPGERVAVVGPNGSGKTTLARLALGLYRPTRGRVLIDGQDLSTLNLEWYRGQVGVVLQENLLVGWSLGDNIALGHGRADQARLEEAARLAGADEFIRPMPAGFETKLGDLGLLLSGGQRQRVNLARALYRNPTLLILDEPTSALDGAGGGSLDQRLAEGLRGRGGLIMTHSVGILKHVDRVLVLDDGQISQER